MKQFISNKIIHFTIIFTKILCNFELLTLPLIPCCFRAISGDIKPPVPSTNKTTQRNNTCPCLLLRI